MMIPSHHPQGKESGGGGKGVGGEKTGKDGDRTRRFSLQVLLVLSITHGVRHRAIKHAVEGRGPKGNSSFFFSFSLLLLLKGGRRLHAALMQVWGERSEARLKGAAAGPTPSTTQHNTT
eukprot:Sspe_Gene.116072::Locus_104453_Transcript_1_1_Confidence_1.000_Length_433::g.116072::m.116072